jgi:hypothetical protein
VLNQAEIRSLQVKVRELEATTQELQSGLQESEHYYELQKASYDRIAREHFVLMDETVPSLLSRISELEKACKPSGILRIPEPDKKPGIVIFQRNIYKS